MPKISTSLVEEAHSYTRSKSPWIIEPLRGGSDAAGRGASGRRERLLHYLSGGGLKAFGRTLREDEADMKRTRFLVAFGAMFAVWLYFWI